MKDTGHKFFMYESDRGNFVAIKHIAGFKPEILRSIDGQNYYPMITSLLNKDNICNINDVFLGFLSTLKISDDDSAIYFDYYQEYYELTGTLDETKVNIMPLPDKRVGVCAFEAWGNIFIYVSEDQYRPNLTKIFIGPLERMLQATLEPKNHIVTNFDGRTVYKTSLGDLVTYPQRFEGLVGPTWKGLPIRKLKIENYTVEEIGNVVRITEK